MRPHDVAVAVVHATRGRPEKAQAVRRDYLEKAVLPGRVVYTLVVDEDDPTAGGDHIPYVPGLPVHVVKPRGCVAAFNEGARTLAAGLLKHEPEAVLVVAADDVIPPPGWDVAILERLGDTTLPRVLAVSDGHRSDKLIPHPILTMARLVQQGGDVFRRDYENGGDVYADRDFTESAYADGVVIEARDLVFEHHHPSHCPDVPMDDVYRRYMNSGAGERGRMIYQRRWPGNRLGLG